MASLAPKHCIAGRLNSSELLIKNYSLIKGEEKIYNSKECPVQSFCPKSGSSICYINKKIPEHIFIARAFLDRDPTLSPREYLFVKDKTIWYDFYIDIP
jgi:hypothetical protein